MFPFNPYSLQLIPSKQRSCVRKQELNKVFQKEDKQSKQFKSSKVEEDSLSGSIHEAMEKLSANCTFNCTKENFGKSTHEAVEKLPRCTTELEQQLAQALQYQQSIIKALTSKLEAHGQQMEKFEDDVLTRVQKLEENLASFIHPSCQLLAKEQLGAQNNILSIFDDKNRIKSINLTRKIKMPYGVGRIARNDFALMINEILVANDEDSDDFDCDKNVDESESDQEFEDEVDRNVDESESDQEFENELEARSELSQNEKGDDAPPYSSLPTRKIDLEDFNIWKKLQRTKANITFGQLLEFDSKAARNSILKFLSALEDSRK